MTDIIRPRVRAVRPSRLREHHDARGLRFESPPEQSFTMQTVVLEKLHSHTAKPALPQLREVCAIHRQPRSQ